MVMDHLLKIYSVLKTPSVDIGDLKGSDIHRFMDVSLASAEKINHEPELKHQVSDILFQLLATQEHNKEATFDIIDSMFESASKACLIDKERELIHWLQVCVSAAVQYGLELKNEPHKSKNSEPPTTARSVSRSPRKASPRKSSPRKKTKDDDDDYVESDDNSEEEAVVPSTPKPTKKKSPKKKLEQEVESPRKSSPKKSTKKKQASDDDYRTETDFSSEESDGECYGLLGESNDSASDDDKSGDDVAVVPEKTRKSKKDTKSAKKKLGDQEAPVRRKPLKEATLPIIEAGAGSKAIAKYFLDFDKEDGHDSALSPGYFTRSFFFPSKDSFNAFISALNSATKSIDICVFAFTDDEVVETLIAAKERGVKITIITDNQQAAGKGADVKRLHEENGIPFRTDKTSGYMHNKFAIIDNATLINGSFNWSKGARFKNNENIIITNIPLLIRQFKTQFDILWEDFA